MSNINPTEPNATTTQSRPTLESEQTAIDGGVRHKPYPDIDWVDRGNGERISWKSRAGGEMYYEGRFEGNLPVAMAGGIVGLGMMAGGLGSFMLKPSLSRGALGVGAALAGAAVAYGGGKLADHFGHATSGHEAMSIEDFVSETRQQPLDLSGRHVGSIFGGMALGATLGGVLGHTVVPGELESLHAIAPYSGMFAGVVAGALAGHFIDRALND